MTTGSSVDDFRTMSLNTGYLTGAYRSKTWYGGDDPPEPKPSKSPATYVTRSVGRAGVQRFRVLRSRSFPKKKKHVDFHAYNCAIVATREQDVQGLYQGQPVWANTINFRISMPAPETLWDSNDQLRLIGKLREEVTGSDLDPGVVLGEAAQTLNLVADSAVRIAKSVRQVRRFDFYGALRTLLDGTGRKPKSRHATQGRMSTIEEAARREGEVGTYKFWLEIQYGWRPLLQDAEDGARYVAHKVNVPFVKKVRATRRKSEASSRFFTGSSGLVFNSEGYRYYQRSIIAVMARVPSFTTFTDLALQSATVAWEVTPWSFVADWFIPIGQFLSAEGFARSMRADYWTIERSGSLQEFDKSSSCEPNPYFSVRYIRTTSSALDVPLPQFKGFSKVASWQHCANAIALLGSTFR